MTADAMSLDVREVSVLYGANCVLDRVSLRASGGEFIALLGASGCGKTTLLRAICGFVAVASGSIAVGERDITRLPPDKRNIAMVFQSYALWPHMTVAQNIGYGLKLRGVGRAEIARRVAELLAMLRLEGLGERKVTALSGGQRQRVALGRALAINPQILLLDEPLSNLDAKLRVQLRWELRALQQRLGMTFVYVTHDQDEALSLSDWIAVMNAGKVEQAGTPWEIYYHPRTSFLADFVGAVNLVPGTVREVRGDEVVVAFGERAVTVRRPSGLALAAGREVRLCVRPEALALRPPAADPDGFRLPGIVARRAFLGDLMRYWVTVDGREWIVDQPDPGAAADFDGPVTVAVKPERIHVIAE